MEHNFLTFELPGGKIVIGTAANGSFLIARDENIDELEKIGDALISHGTILSYQVARFVRPRQQRKLSS